MEQYNHSHKKRVLLQKEFLLFWNSIPIWLLRLSGWSRIDIEDGNIVSKTTFSIFYNFICIISLNCSLGYIIYSMAVVKDYLWMNEILLVSWFAFYFTVNLIHNVFANRHGGAKILNYFIDIDILLGAVQTKFIRRVAVRTYAFYCVICAVAEIMVLAAVAHTYKADLLTFPAGFFYFFEVYNAYYDLISFFALFNSLTMRVRFVNVALMKIANMDPDLMPKQFPFNTFFWVSRFDSLVDFHKRADADDFTMAYKMIFNQLRNFESTYRCSTALNVIGGFLGCFLTVQSVVTYEYETSVAMHRLFGIMGWCVIAWFIIYMIAEQIDMFIRQIYQTHLICTCIQLKPNYSDEIYDLTSKVIEILENHDPQVNIYDLYYLDKGAILRFLGSIFVYITMQLQIAFPKKNDFITVDNITTIDYLVGN